MNRRRMRVDHYGLDFTPIVLGISELDKMIQIQAEFANGLPKGINGPLGTSGFLDPCSKICFFPKKHALSIEP